MQIDLNIFRTIIVINLQKKSAGRHRCNNLSSTKRASNYKDKMFPDGDLLYDTIKDASHWILFLTIKPKNMIHIKFALDFCDVYPEYNNPDKELYDGPNASLIYFIVYAYQVRCATHGIIPNGPSLCRICE